MLTVPTSPHQLGNVQNRSGAVDDRGGGGSAGNRQMKKNNLRRLWEKV